MSNTECLNSSIMIGVLASVNLSVSEETRVLKYPRMMGRKWFYLLISIVFRVSVFHPSSRPAASPNEKSEYILNPRKNYLYHLYRQRPGILGNIQMFDSDRSGGKTKFPFTVFFFGKAIASWFFTEKPYWAKSLNSNGWKMNIKNQYFPD